jgi:hypothetical protein
MHHIENVAVVTHKGKYYLVLFPFKNPVFVARTQSAEKKGGY